MSKFQFIILTPSGSVDPSVAIAASRAGELGVLDLEYVHDEKMAIRALSRLKRYTKNPCGIKISGNDERLLNLLVPQLERPIETVILTPHVDSRRLAKLVELLHSLCLTVVLETTCIEQAVSGENLGVDGLIAKGNESGGWVGEETTFILLQRLLRCSSLPVWAQGGIGIHTAAACCAAGAAGVVLDTQCLLTCESPISESARAAVIRFDGSQSICLGEELGLSCRVYGRPGLKVIQELHRVTELLIQEQEKGKTWEEVLGEFRREVHARVGWGDPDRDLWLIGQDDFLGGSIRRRTPAVSELLVDLRNAIDNQIQVARTLKPFSEGSPLAVSHGTRYPIVQGPMTRVSDRAPFALKVAEGGGLPFVAFGVLRASEILPVVEETRLLLGERPWGVGMLGFIDPDLYQEQLSVIRAIRPPCLLIAGGRPDQANALEQEGIPTYLHVPSSGLLRIYIQDGARRFIFEGRECGGHVGPRSSFALWNSMVQVLLDSLSSVDADQYHVLFAGGIHDDLSSSMVAAVAAPLAERGVRVGVLIGTAYLFTEEAVETGAILRGFQEEAMRCEQTTLLESGPGHVSRCALTPFTETFKREKRRLCEEGKSVEEVRMGLEHLNLGRLRAAAKGVRRNERCGLDSQVPKYRMLSEDEQRRDGMYMIGQVAALHNRTFTIHDLHYNISVRGMDRLDRLRVDQPSLMETDSVKKPFAIAIIGMSCLMPRASNLLAYWENILNKVDAVREIPPDRWDWRLYYDPDQSVRDKIVSKWGGFLDPIPFDP
ncbi:MAG: nitronate monooxygenase, partial [Desulforhabdus sp.]|nr:nitronate monooxygenase [Desulforhabdus sp.]